MTATSFPFSLNTEQERAATQASKHSLVLAGAGSGKTRIITAKIFYLLTTLGLLPSKILAITFTNKAAEEMRSRLLNMIPTLRKNGLNVFTFHAFGLRFLRTHIHWLAPYRPNFSLVDDAVKKTVIKNLVKEHLLKFPEQEHIFNDQATMQLSRFISLCKNRLYFPDNENLTEQVDRFFNFRKKTQKKYFIELYLLYDEQMKDNNSLDFDDLIVLPLRLAYNEASCYRWFENIDYLLVDEYQDTDFAQEKLIELFAKAGAKITAVGDDNQSIYGFRGANVFNILSFQKKYKNVEIYVLEENYRSTGSILALANAVIANNPKQYPKNLFSNGEQGVKPKYFRFERDFDEASWVAKKIAALIAQGENPEEIAIFYRTNYQSRLFEEALLNRSIPYRVVKGMRFYERKEVKETLHYLRFLSNQQDGLAFWAALNFPPRSLGAQSKKIFENILVEKRLMPGELLENHQYVLSKLSSRSAAGFESFYRFTEEFKEKQAKGMSLSESIYFVIQKSGLLAYYEKIKDKHEKDQRLGSLNQFVQSAREFEQRPSEGQQSGQGQQASLVEFLEGILLTGNIDNQKDNSETAKAFVNLLTVHNAKGLEYKHVFVSGLEQYCFPHRLSFSSQAEIEEERRLFYVAVTRAKRHLTLSSVRLRALRSYPEFFETSMFLREISQAFFAAESCKVLSENSYFR